MGGFELSFWGGDGKDDAGTSFFGPLDNHFPHPHPVIFDVGPSCCCVAGPLLLCDTATCCRERELIFCNTTGGSSDPTGSPDGILLALLDILLIISFHVCDCIKDEMSPRSSQCVSLD